MFQDWLLALTAVALRVYPEDIVQEAFDKLIDRVLRLSGVQSHAAWVSVAGAVQRRGWATEVVVSHVSQASDAASPCCSLLNTHALF